MKNIKEPTFNTGDINLAAACMSVGVPLADASPCSVVKHDNGKDYTRFHLKLLSEDGKYSTSKLMTYWDNPQSCKDPFFAEVMQFISFAIPQRPGRRDWFDLAHAFLTDRGSMGFRPSKFSDIVEYVRANPESVDTHIFAFVYNRETCHKLCQNARPRVMITQGENHVMIDESLPKVQQHELLSRFE